MAEAEHMKDGASMRVSRVTVAGLALSLSAAVLAVLSGFGVRRGLWDFRSGLTLLRWAAYGGVLSGMVSLIGCLVTLTGKRVMKKPGLILAFAGIIVSMVVAGVPLSWLNTARRVPPIHDITTDTENPPRFVAILPLRKGALNPVEYGGPEVAAMQHKAYPGIAPLTLDRDPARTFDEALGAARELGWKIIDSSEDDGRIEATDETFWFGFKDDIVIRVTATDHGSRVDARSLSRVGRSDVGTNARRIKKFLDTLEKRLSA